MRITAHLRRQVTWLALCAVTFVAIAPAISHWIAASTGLTWVEICSVSGPKRVALDTGSTPAPTEDHASTSHCPFCRLQNHLPALPQSDIALVILTAVQGDTPSAQDTLPLRTKPLWAQALSRAPPAFS